MLSRVSRSPCANRFEFPQAHKKRLYSRIKNTFVCSGLCRLSFAWGAQNAGAGRRGGAAPVLEAGVRRRPASISSARLAVEFRPQC